MNVARVKLLKKLLFASPVLAAMLLVTSTLEAETVYRTVDEDGNVTYSTTPSSGDSERVDVQETNTIKLHKPKVVNKASSGADEEEKQETGISITSPVNDEVIQGVPMPATVLVSVDYSSQSGALVQLYVNGVAYGEPGPQSQIQVSQLWRGSYTLRAVLVDADGKVLASSETVNLHVKHRFVKR
jgi:hypothetical protein